MKGMGIMLLGALSAALPLPCRAESACAWVEVRSRVEVVKQELALVDLLTPESCIQVQQAAGEISLGAAPRAGNTRVIDGGEVRRLLVEIAARNLFSETIAAMKIPERVVVQRIGQMKSCAEIAGFISSASPSSDATNGRDRWRGWNCAAAGAVPQDASLRLMRTNWNAGLQRWEFTLRCADAGDCVPFLVWARGEEPVPAHTRPKELAKSDSLASLGERVVQAGQTATLTWDQSGIRMVLPVTCLDGGAIGQSVRVRLINTSRILRAEVVGAGALRVNL